jgi:hypothetical protein
MGGVVEDAVGVFRGHAEHVGSLRTDVDGRRVDLVVEPGAAGGHGAVVCDGLAAPELACDPERFEDPP